MTKQCWSCKRGLFLDNFVKDRSRKDGLSHTCRNCMRLCLQKYRKGNNYKIIHRKAESLYLKKYPHIATAHRIAKKNKLSLLKSACEECGKTGKLEMHHSNYSEPLSVITLCGLCHRKKHMQYVTA